MGSNNVREKAEAAYDALDMREKSEIAAQHPRYCYAKGYAAALSVAPATDAKYRAVVRAFDALARGDLRALGTVHEDIQGSVDAIVARLRAAPPATGDAAAVALLADARKCVALANTNGYYDVWLARCDRVIAAATHAAKESRSDDSPDAGQGGV